ncbi:glycoside hydrolase family 16 protein [Mycena leptocephala]|nr:glycoside hydrolase family 16 protein [Mycena leptocephala]
MAHSRQGYQREASPNLLPKPDDWEAVPSSPGSGLADKFSLSPDPTLWGSNLSPNHAEPDDILHNPEFKDGKLVDRPNSSGISARGVANIGCLAILCLGLVALFLGYPVVSFVEQTFLSPSKGGTPVNATGQVASIGNFGLIDLETPADAYTITSLYSGREMKLVFSDEFNTAGRTFYPGDDPYWEAVDLHYWATNNMEWYDPAAVTTANGAMKITLSATENHNLSYTGGGLLVTTLHCPAPTISMAYGRVLDHVLCSRGNLGRAGYGASLDGMWPYTYDACDVGTAPNQTIQGKPEIALTSGDKDHPYNGELSYLGGQRLSRCTCPGESHPGPIHQSDNSYVGRSAPEIDVFEAQIQDGEGAVSQSGQWAPFNAGYVWFNTSDNLVIADPTISVLNTYTGGAYQQATSVVTKTNQRCYELLDNCYSLYGMEYKPVDPNLHQGFDDSYISWISDNKLAWTVHAAGLAADPKTEIDRRPVPQEPMYILANLGMSTNFGTVDVEHLTFPTTLSLDYVRVYQYADSINIGCDPPDFPTQQYINTYIEAYTNPLLTTWVNDYGQTIPKSSLVDGC